MIDILVATTPDKSAVTAVAKQPVDPEKITTCLRRASQRIGGARVVDAQAVGIPFTKDGYNFAVAGELRLSRRAAEEASAAEHAVATELKRAGFSVR
jgi:hypothetical protein